MVDWNDLTKDLTPILISLPGMYQGYMLEDLEQMLEPDTWERFKEWINGQTMAVISGEELKDRAGKPIVYRHDVNRFLAGLPVID